MHESLQLSINGFVEFKLLVGPTETTDRSKSFLYLSRMLLNAAMTLSTTRDGHLHPDHLDGASRLIEITRTVTVHRALRSQDPRARV